MDNQTQSDKLSTADRIKLLDFSSRVPPCPLLTRAITKLRTSRDHRQGSRVFCCWRVSDWVMYGCVTCHEAASHVTWHVTADGRCYIIWGLLTGGVLAAGVPVRAVDDRELHQLPLLQLVLALALKHRLLKTILGSTSNSSNELVKMNLFDFRRKAPTLPPSRDTEGVYLGGCVCCVGWE